MLTKDNSWPINPKFLDESGRRRLSDVATDRWKAEEEDFKNQLTNGKITRPVQKQQVETHSLRVSNEKKQIINNSQLFLRKMQLPPISKTCVNPEDPVVPCPPANLGQICDKYNGGDFETCFQTCKPSVSS
jgi:hypothetical protein